MIIAVSFLTYGAFLLLPPPSCARLAAAELSSPFDTRSLVKRIVTPQNATLAPIPGPCDGPVKCVFGACCPADQYCQRNGCAPVKSQSCADGWCPEGWGCCGLGGCYDKAAGQCCPNAGGAPGGIHGVWCPTVSQCIPLGRNDWTCDTTTPTAPTPTPYSGPTTCNPSGSQPTFKLQQINSTDAQNGTFAALSAPKGSREVVFGLEAANGTNFTFNSACNLADAEKEIADIHGPLGASFSPVYFDKGDNISAMGYIETVCDIKKGQLTCAANGKTLWMACGSDKSLAIGSQIGSGCFSVALAADFV